MRRLALSMLILLIAATNSQAFADDPIRPDSRLTPGAVASNDKNEVCQSGYSKEHRHTSGRLKADIYREYGLEKRNGHYEIDHLIPLALGGADEAENLWPESFDTMPWNAQVKDRLEVRLHELVCFGGLPIEQAQHDIATDWIAAFQKYVGNAPD